jgi:hypothetical protein
MTTPFIYFSKRSSFADAKICLRKYPPKFFLGLYNKEEVIRQVSHFKVNVLRPPII